MTLTALVSTASFRYPRLGLAQCLIETAGIWGRSLRRLLLAASFAQDDSGSGIATEELIARFQRGQGRMFEALYERFKDYVYRVALYATRDGREAEDAVQDTFLDVLRALPTYRIDGPARFETWLYRVTINRCRTRTRRKRLPRAEWDDLEERLERLPTGNPGHNPQSILFRAETAASLWRAVDELPQGQRLAVLLRYQQGLSYQEIAQTLGIKEGTVKSRLYYAHRKLKEHLVQDGEAAGGRDA